jgi:hypothetical protein
MTDKQEDMRLGELLILAFLWMLFGFMIWYYLSAFHGIPVRAMASFVLQYLLGDSFYNIVANPDHHYLLQVQTQIQFSFPDGSKEALGFIVNPLTYGYGLPLLFGLVMASEATLWHKLRVMLLGYVVISMVQVWGVVWQSLKMLAFNFGSQTHQVIMDAGLSETVIAMAYQLGVLIFPPLAPVILWVLANWRMVEQFTGWKPEPRG